MSRPPIRILGIETSCDDTGVAVFDEHEGLLAHALHSQTDTHTRYGGVVPELASRDHTRKLVPTIERMFKQVKIPFNSITGIAYTAGPGLVGALLVGAAFGKALGYAWNIPSLGIHHMEGHLLAPLLEDPAPAFPFLALLISGGHTLLVEVSGIGEYKVLGASLDDAAGEAFDKTAKLLGLPYPGGPALAALAEQGVDRRFRFPRPLTDKPGLDFSFSGLKTSVMNAFKKTTQSLQDKADIAHAFQEAIVDTLFLKCQKAIQLTGLERLVVAGGVSANQWLRRTFTQLTTLHNTALYYPRLEFCTDNGAMIAFAGYHRFKMTQGITRRNSLSDLEILAYPRWPIDALKTD